MLHVDRKAHSWKLLLNVAYLHRIELITTMYMGFIVLIITSYLVYLAERDFIVAETRPFESYADALWFGIVTGKTKRNETKEKNEMFSLVATIGYGDRVPHTCVLIFFRFFFFNFDHFEFLGAGKIVTACLSMIGIAFFSLPAVRKSFEFRKEKQTICFFFFFLGNSRCVETEKRFYFVQLRSFLFLFRFGFCVTRSTERKTKDVS